MRFYIYYLLLAVAFFLSSEKAMADVSCLQPSMVADKSIELKLQQLEGQDGRHMISSGWHETHMPNFINCKGMDPKNIYTYYLSYRNGSALPSAYVFEGDAYEVLPTTNPNVGVIYSTSLSGEGFKPMGSTFGNYFSFKGNSDGTLKTGIIYRYRYIALKRLPAGKIVLSIDPLQKAAWMWDSDSRGRPSVRAYILYLFNGPPSVTITVNNTSCSLKAPSTVALKKANLSLMPSVNSTAEGAAFQLGVTCGASYAPYKVLYSMSDVRTPDNNTSMLTLASGAGNASGVSLQVMDGDTPVVFSAASAASASKSLMGAMTTQGGSIGKPFNVRYIRTGAQIAPGTVSAGVAVTLVYE